MSLIQNRIMHPHLREDETLVVENAIRIAIDSIINVLYGVNSAKTQEYQRMVADRDKDIQRLECRSKENERELQVLRKQRCICGLVGSERRHHVPPDTASVPNREEGAHFEPDCIGSEMTIGQECEMNISCLFARAPSLVPSLCHETAPPPPPPPPPASSRMIFEQSCPSQSSEAPGLSEETNHSSSVNSLVVKEEPCDIDTVLIKWEMSEQSYVDQQESSDTSCQDKDSPNMKRKVENRERLRRFRERLYSDPDRHHVYKEGERLRNFKRSVPMSELPEETQRLKRAAWRAASRRYYARKVARQQPNPTQYIHFPQNTFLPRPQPPPVPLPEKKKKTTLISELPEETQTLQREAWRAASKRYYARKMARLQVDPIGLGHFLQNTDLLGAAGGHGIGGPLHNNIDLLGGAGGHSIGGPLHNNIDLLGGAGGHSIGGPLHNNIDLFGGIGGHGIGGSLHNTDLLGGAGGHGIGGPLHNTDLLGGAGGHSIGPLHNTDLLGGAGGHSIGPLHNTDLLGGAGGHSIGPLHNTDLLGGAGGHSIGPLHNTDLLRGAGGHGIGGPLHNTDLLGGAGGHSIGGPLHNTDLLGGAGGHGIGGPLHNTDLLGGAGGHGIGGPLHNNTAGVGGLLCSNIA